MTITSLLTGYKSVVVFKEPSYFSSAKNEVSVTILNEQNREVGWMSGTWDSVVWRYEKSSPKIKAEIWRARPLPENHKQMYGFTQFAIELNELTPDMLECLPYTDTRLRPDQRLLEEGRLVEAEAEKLRLEAKQRDARKRREKDGEVWEPKWFAAGIDGSWYIRRNATSQAEYFECRRTRSFKCSKEIERIF
ncbi:hypothetical protein HDU82_008121 [Entophlyctis luteolus]|nr:hypothetical protein HDU82_008121 [Entophlyctis luteolus]